MEDADGRRAFADLTEIDQIDGDFKVPVARAFRTIIVEAGGVPLVIST